MLYLRIILIPLLVFSLSTNGQDYISRTKDLGLKGEVQSVKEVSYEARSYLGNISKTTRKRENGGLDFINKYNETGCLIEKDLFSVGEDGEIFKKELYYYDESNKLTDKKEFMDNGTLNLHYKYSYNSKGKITNVTAYEKMNVIFESWDVKYYNNGRQSDFIVYERGSSKSISTKTSIFYDAIGNNTEIHYFDTYVDFLSEGGSIDVVKVAEKTPSSKTVNKFDSKGREIESIYYSPVSSVDSREEKQYDLSGNLIEEAFYDGNSQKFYKKVVYKYNKFDDVIEEKTLTKNEFSSTIRRYDYKYDNKGNWIEKIVFLNNIPQFLIEREVKYF